MYYLFFTSIATSSNNVSHCQKCNDNGKFATAETLATETVAAPALASLAKATHLGLFLLVVMGSKEGIRAATWSVSQAF